MNKIRINKNDLVVCIFFFLISFCKGLGLNNSNDYYLLIYFGGIIFATLKLFKVRFNRREILLLLLIILIGMLDYVFGNETTILFTGITLFFLKNIDLKYIIKALFLGRLLGFLLMIIFPIIGIIPMNTMKFYRAGSFIERYAFGYSHPNLMHSTFNIIVIMWLYLYYDKIKFKNFVFFEIINYLIYRYTFSRTGFIILTLSLMISYISKINKKIQNKLPKLLNFTFIFSFLLGIIFAIGYEKWDFINKIDILLTGRIKYTSILINNYIPPIIKTKEYTGILFDNGYFDLLYNGGILATIWFVIMQIKTNNYINKNSLHKEALLIIILFVYSITESYYISSVMNVGIFFLSYSIFEFSKQNNKKML